MLVIGDVGRWNASGHGPPTLPNCHFAGIEQLDAALLNDLKPDFIVSALIGNSTDAVDIAERLTRLKYNGAYRAVVSTHLPNTRVVLSEISAIAPDLDFDIFLFQRQGD